MPIIKSKYNSLDLYSLPPFKEAIHDILHSQTTRDWHKPCFAILLMTGARVSEALNIKKKDLVFFDERGNVVEPLDSGTNIYKIVINILTIKQRTQIKKFRKIPLLFVMNDGDPTDLVPLLPLVILHWKGVSDDEGFLFPFSRHTVKWALKKFVCLDYYPHLFRHMQATRDALGGMNEFAMVKKYGWHDIRPATSYVSLTAKDIEGEQLKVYDRDSISSSRVVVERLVKKEPLIEIVTPRALNRLVLVDKVIKSDVSIVF